MPLGGTTSTMAGSSVTTDQAESYRRGAARITDEGLNRVYAQLGKVTPARSWARTLSFDITSHFALYCMGSDNPLWMDPDYLSAAADGPQPPPFVEYVSASADKRMGGVGLPGVFALHATDEWTSESRPGAGETVSATMSLAAADLRESKWGGRALWQTREVVFYGADGRLLSTYRPTSVRAERLEARRRGGDTPVEDWVYSDEDLERVRDGYETEEIRGARPRYIEDVHVGDPIGHVVKGPLTVMDLMCWWMGAGGPYVQAFKQRYLIQKRHPALAILDEVTRVPRSPEDAHFDTSYARRSGVRQMYDIGRQRLASVLHLGTNWCGDAGRVTRVHHRLLSSFYVGDTTWYSGQVTEVSPETGRVTCSVTGISQRDIKHTEGTLEIELPRRGGARA
jgi:hypothetical protein